MTMFDEDLQKTSANYVPLSPLSFLPRTAALFPDRLAWIDGEHSCNWAQYFERCRRFASALSKRGLAAGDTVACILPNCPAMLEAHFAIPAIGAVINTLNTRLNPSTLAFCIEHGEARVLLVSADLVDLARAALDVVSGPRPLVVEVADEGEPITLGDVSYEDFLTEGDPSHPWSGPKDEWDAVALNYTSGTTGDPKGVVVHHRGAYLNAVMNAIETQMDASCVYLWTLPMFHCNGWCFPWTLALVGGVSICLPKVDPEAIFDLIERHGVTHMCGAPIVYRMLVNHAASKKPSHHGPIIGLLGGASPPAAVIEGCERLGIDISHAYGLTEVYGPAALCVPQPEWASRPLTERAGLLSRQGVSGCLQEDMSVLDTETFETVPSDGQTVGEVVFRGNIVMKGYLKNPAATKEAFRGGWFRTGDLAVKDADGYVKIVDRSKDIIISGGENISSVEIEDVLYRHPAVLFAAVVAKADEHWGETPCAFIETRAGATVSAEEIIDFCRARLAHFKAPEEVRFGELPKTSTGKIQKYVLRSRAAQPEANAPQATT